MLSRYKARTLLSDGFQHSTPVNWHMYPSVPLLENSHEESAPLGSPSDSFRLRKHRTSLAVPEHDDKLLRSSIQMIVRFIIM
jgi:hypothetical protein